MGMLMQTWTKPPTLIQIQTKTWIYSGPCEGGCVGGDTCCGTSCVDLSSDNRHCGECGRQCGDGLSCEDGTCVCYGIGGHLPIECLVDEACCVDAATGLPLCVNLEIGRLETDDYENTNHCGSCGTVCGDFACRSGECCYLYDPEEHTYEEGCPTPDDELPEGCGGSCGPGGTCCEDRCVNTETDEKHCGACGQSCGLGAVCIDGGCRCTYSSGGYESSMDCRSWGACCRGPSPAQEHCVNPALGEMISPDPYQIYHCGDCNQACAAPGGGHYLDTPTCTEEGRCRVATHPGLCTDSPDTCPEVPLGPQNVVLTCEDFRCVVEYDTYFFAF
jgi:hypothetical protein